MLLGVYGISVEYGEDWVVSDIGLVGVEVFVWGGSC
jgi:hypothetical protein